MAKFKLGEKVLFAEFGHVKDGIVTKVIEQLPKQETQEYLVTRTEDLRLCESRLRKRGE